MTTSLFVDRFIGTGPERTGPPVGRAFVAFTGVVALLFSMAAIELIGVLRFPSSASSQLGVVATTTFAVSGFAAAHRAMVIRSWWAGAIAVVLLGPGATWSWANFVATLPGARGASPLIVLAAGALSVVLLTKGLRLAHWLEVFGGLGSCGLTMVASLVRLDSAAASSTFPALLAAVSGMICLYGLLVDVEVAEHRSLTELVESRKRIATEVSQVEELLHDLRGGLLAVEAAIGTFDGELAGPLRAEMARLRRLTVIGARTVTAFDLVASVDNLAAARRAAGLTIDLITPPSATVWGEASEILAIVDNLVSNADRHGEPGRITVEISAGDDNVRLVVRNPGTLQAGDPDSVFRRGMTTHPDGLGVGLARARMLAELNGAELRIGPAEAGHTSFVLNLTSETSSAVA